MIINEVQRTIVDKELENVVDVSIIIPTYNRNRVLRKTLESLRTLNPGPREILVIDQSKSHDAETQAFLQDAISRKEIEYIYQDKPNAQRARNVGIERALGEVLLFLDDDVVVDSGLVGAHWKNYEDRTLGAVCGFFLDPGEVPIFELPEVCRRPTTGWIYAPHCYAKRTTNYSWPSGNGSVRRKIAIEVGGFDENFTKTLFDDTDFCGRLLKHGVRNVHDPEARMLHLKEPSGGSRPGSANLFVIADAAQWYTWIYFFIGTFGVASAKEILTRFRGCVLRKSLVMRPWYLGLATLYFIQGFMKATTTLARGRKLATFKSDVPPGRLSPQVPTSKINVSDSVHS